MKTNLHCIGWRPLRAHAPMLVILMFLLLGASWLHPVRAASSVGTVVGTGTPNSCSAAALEAALAAGGSITFDCGSDPVTITVTRQNTIGVDTTLDGSGLVTLSGGGTTGILIINVGVRLTVTNLTISNSDGSAVINNGTLMVTNSTFSGNNAGSGGLGAAMYNNGTLDVTNANLLGNLAERGSAIENVTGVLNVTSSTFSGNSGLGSSGGAINSAVRDGPGSNSVTVTDCHFTANSGGAITNEVSGRPGSGSLTVSGSTFTTNIGGAILSFVEFEGSGNAAASIVVNDSTFTANSGGAAITSTISGGMGSLNVSNSTFRDNSFSAGAAISTWAFYGTNNVTVDNSVFSGNSSTLTGGAIENEINSGAVGSLTVNNSTFSGNSALNGGGAIFHQGDAGGAAGLAVSNSTFDGNSSQYLGGAIFAWHSGPGRVTVSNSTFSDNSALYYGGAIETGDSHITVSNSTFSGNRAADGGVVFNSSDRSVILFQNTIVSGVTGRNCNGRVSDGGDNLDSDGTCDIGFATDPRLDPRGLADNGGPTQTIALEAGSLAINAGNQAVCGTGPVWNLDQRGLDVANLSH